MATSTRNLLLFAGVALLFILTGLFQSWNLSLQILNIGILSAIMALGVNMQWGYAGLFSTGIVGSVALGGLAVVVVSAKPVPEGFAAGGWAVLGGLALGVAVIVAATLLYRAMKPGRLRALAVTALVVAGFFLYRYVFDQGVAAVEAFNPATYGNIGGFGLPSLLAWPVGAIFAGLGAWVIGKIALGLRSDYLAIATLGIAEIIVVVLKSEDWLARGVKNVTGLPRPWPVPYEVDLQADPEFVARVTGWGFDPITASTIFVKLLYLAIFGAVLLAIIWASERALNSPWGRMMRAIRDNEVAASAMGKNVTRRHLQIFIIGSAVVGLAGAMLTSMEGQLVPGVYSPLRFTFLIWVMVIVGGSGNNWGAVLGGLLLGWLWLAVEYLGPGLMGWLTAALPAGDLKTHLIDSAQHMRLVTLGIVLLLVLRFAPRGLIPEK
ncbi:branched-chain amino acid ABC transporter permease [Tabrizicola oligotrophica]|uniref:Branched-chain amino acid ABC transporter permease n=1 Tax=Tabrizicola oligotrophica TaxID=2710650 RepID=A0A6M0QN54_9RHOB|nr:branched-chain amino acid ABC transporter permease [Tabrizicola oligotrophica]NEY88835.1 branched-chain amino acid ABC transporter permease [Tabrizicola oligotrophica]